MGFRRSVLISTLCIGVIAVLGLGSKSDESSSKFEAHEFAVFRSEYDGLKIQNVEKRVEHFRDLLDRVESVHMTPSMNDTLAGFCRSVVASEEEAPVVKDEVKLVLRTLSKQIPTREPASVEKAK